MNIIKHRLIFTEAINKIKIPSVRRRFLQASVISSARKKTEPVEEKKSKKDTFYVTTPIYYVNAEPHIGHLYSSLIADAVCRWQHSKQKSGKFKFSTGTDEHGAKIEQAAVLNRNVPLGYCDKISKRYKYLAEEFEINYTDFIRTTNKQHLKTVEKFWNVLESKGHIYSSNYEGWYCVSDETFLSKSQLKEVIGNDGKKSLVSEESGHPVEWTSEKNYMFRLSSFQDELIKWLKSNEKAVHPRKFYKILMDSITREALPDLSVSRPASRVSWGIPVPSDPTQTIYVWLDALVNYLTAAGYENDEESFQRIWPPDAQVIGKDILKFHGIYWPAFLLAADLEPPKCLLCHSHWTVASEKMSKSKKNVVDPFDRANIYTSEGFRYFLLRVGVAHTDGNYNDHKVIRVLNSELADSIGNLLNRCTSATLNPKQEFPEIQKNAFEDVMQVDVARQLIENLRVLPETCEQHYDDCNFYKAIDAVIATIHSANLFFESMKPWELKKNTENLEKLNVVLHITIECLRIVGILLQPVVPNLTTNLLDKLNVEVDDRYFENCFEVSWRNPNFRTKSLSSDKIVLFRRILLEDKKKIPVK